MFEYTSQNHFQFGYSTKRWFCNRQSPDETFVAQFGRVKLPLRSWREANLMACQTIRRNFSGDLWVLFSGGTDSEICIRSFLEAKIPIKIATLRFKDGLNSHDLEYVKKLKEKLNLQIEYFEIDILDFLNSEELNKIVNPIECVSPILAAHLWLADQLVGVPIIAQGEPYFKKTVSAEYQPGVSPYERSAWKLVESERLCSLYKHFIFKNKPAVPGFFQYLPEQFYAYLKFNPILQKLVKDEVIGKLGTRSSKNTMSYQFYPEVEPREKFTGFEALELAHDQKRAELAERFQNSDQNFFIEFQDLVNCLSLT